MGECFCTSEGGQYLNIQNNKKVVSTRTNNPVDMWENKITGPI